MPGILVNRSKLRHNLNFIKRCCQSRGLEMVAVLKSAHVIPSIMEIFKSANSFSLAFSRIDSLIACNGDLNKHIVLIGIPPLSRVSEVVKHCSASFNSELSVIKALARAAKENGVRHGIYLMVDVGDLREGVLPERTIETMREIFPLLNGDFSFLGLAANFGCASGTLPDTENIQLLQALTEEIENELALEVPGVSVGGTMVLHWIQNNPLPPRINQIRIGEGILCGHVPGYDQKMKGLYEDAFLLQGEVLEVKEKVSPPPGQRGLDAFGHQPSLGQAGRRRRAILDFGMVDTIRTGLTPCLEGLQIITSNSEYTIVDVTECQENIQVGDSIEFKLNYEALTQALLSPFVEPRVCE